MKSLRLAPLTAAIVPAIQAWFDDSETRRWLGNRNWLSMVLSLAANPPTQHRGRAVLDRRAWIVEEEDVPVGVIDVEVYEDRTAGLAFVIAPDRRGSGVGRRALRAMVEQLAESGVREAFGGVDLDNVASIRCMEAAGFTVQSPEPDEEGFLYFARRLDLK